MPSHSSPVLALLALLLAIGAAACSGGGAHRSYGVAAGGQAARPANAAEGGSCPTVPSWGDFTLTVSGAAGATVAGEYDVTNAGQTVSTPLSGQVPLQLTLQAGAVAVAVHTAGGAPAGLTLHLQQPYTLASAGACGAHAQVLETTTLDWSVTTEGGYAAVASTCNAPLLATLSPPAGSAPWPCTPNRLPADGTPAP